MNLKKETFKEVMEPLKKPVRNYEYSKSDHFKKLSALIQIFSPLEKQALEFSKIKVILLHKLF